MEITLNTDRLHNLPNTTLVGLAIVGYMVGAAIYYSIKEQFVGKLLTEQIQIFGNLSRVTHVLSYMFLGYTFPKRFVIIMLLGVGSQPTPNSMMITNRLGKVYPRNM